MISVYIAATHSMFRDGLKGLFEAHHEFDLVGVGNDGSETLRALRGNHADVGVIDLMVSGRNGIEVAEISAAEIPRTKILLLADAAQSHFIYPAMEAGAKGFVLKTYDWRDLAIAIRTIYNGGVVISPGVMAILQSKIATGGLGLTPREDEILRLLSDGYSVPKIAQTLYIAPDTVRTHLRHTYVKLGVQNQASAVAKAIRMDLI